ncbi:MAG: hypothetical protein ACLQRH_00390 [Acidimicrobiales bacterium]
MGNPSGPPAQAWPISEHDAAWQAFSSIEPSAVAYTEELEYPTVFDLAPAQAAPPQAASAEPVRPAPAAQVAAPPSPGVLDVAGQGPTDAGWGLASEPATGSPFEPSSPTDGAGLPKTAKAAPPWRTLALVGALCVVVVVGVVVAVSQLGSSNTPTLSPPSAVLKAAVTTQGLRTARVSMTEKLTPAQGSPVTVTGNGSVDFSTRTSTFRMAVSGQYISVVSTGGNAYMSIPQVAQVFPGKHWVSVPVGNTISAAGGALSGGDPTQMLQFLASQGNVVTSIGSSTVDGVAVQVYDVLINNAEAELQLERSGLPPSVVTAGVQFLKSTGAIAYKVYVDSDNQMREMDFSMAVPGAAGNSVSVQMAFSDFGESIVVSPPPASEVITLQQFLGSAAAAQSAS